MIPEFFTEQTLNLDQLKIVYVEWEFLTILFDSIRFYDRKVKDILAYLRILNNLKDTVSLRRIINFPPRGIGVKTMDKCINPG